MDTEYDFTLAHISDLHFSEGTDQSKQSHAHSIEHLKGIQNRLATLGELDCLIVSGDICARRGFTTPLLTFQRISSIHLHLQTLRTGLQNSSG